MKWLQIFLGLIPGVGFLIVWHTLNHGPPLYDAAKHLLLSWNSYSALTHDGLRAFLATFFARGPYFLSSVGSLFLIATLGNLHMTSALALIFFYAIASIYLTLLIGLYLPPRQTLTAALVLSMKAWLLLIAVLFEMYLPFVACACAAAYYLMTCDFFRRPKRVVLFSLFLILAFSFRPFEAFLIFLWPVAFAAREAVLRRHAPHGQVIGVFIFAGVAIMTSLCAWLWPALSAVYISIVLALCLLVFVLHEYFRSRQTSFLSGAALFLFWVLFWFVPSGSIFYDWAFANSFSSELSAKIGFVGLADLFSFSRFFVGGALAVASLVAVAAFAIDFFKYHEMRRWVRHDSWRFVRGRLEIYFFIGALSLIAMGLPLPVFYSVFAVAIVSIFVLVAALTPRLSYPRLRLTILSAVAVAQVIFIAKVLGPSAVGRNSYLSSTWDFQIDRPMKKDLVKGLTERLVEKVGKADGVNLALLALRSDAPNLATQITRAGLELSLKVLRPNWNIYWGPQASSADHRQILTNFIGKMDYVLVGPVGAPLVHRQGELRDLPQIIVSAYQNEDLKSLGLKLSDRVELDDEDGGHSTYLLLHNAEVAGLN